MENKIAVVGSRGYNNYDYFEAQIKYLTMNMQGDITFVSGGCSSGADKLIKDFCKEYNYELIEFLPNWDLYGKSAGFKRNQLIVEEATHLIAFWNKKSKGTESSVKLAEKKNIPIRIVEI